VSYEIQWGKGSTFNMGLVGGTKYRCERYSVPNKNKNDHWFMLADPYKTYLCTKGPYSTPEERDTAIVEEVRRRETE
jgi:hypothetical protein